MLVIFSKLDIAARDHAWIEVIRGQHDPQQRMVEPHLTFVFPFEGLSPDEVLAHAQVIAGETAPIPFRLSQAAAMRDLLGTGSHLFLLPDQESAREMRALHARLYSGLLALKLHPTATYGPHVTVGAFERHEDATRAAARLSVFAIKGVLRALQIADFDGESLVQLHELPFGSSGGRSPSL